MHGSNVWYQFTVADSANSGNATLAIIDRVAQQPTDAGSYSFSGTSFYPGSAGVYVIAVTVLNADGLFATQNVTLNVAQILSNISSVPASPVVQAGASQAFAALGFDQFGAGMTISNPAWSVGTGGGSISSTGVYNASTTPGVYAINVMSGSVSGVSYVNVVQAPTMTAAVNSGDAQRSMVTEVTLSFSHAVTLGDNAVSIALHPSSVDGTTVGTLPTLSWSSFDGGVNWIVRFSGDGVIGNSIANGMYDLTVNAAGVVDSSLQSPAADSTISFFRLFGDINGDGTVNLIDFRAFQNAYLGSAGQPNYNAAADFDGDGTTNLTDYHAFLSDFLRSRML